MEVIQVISIVLCLLALLPLLMVLLKSRSQQAFVRKAVSTTAEITHCEKRIGWKGVAYYSLTLQYHTMEGRQVKTATVVTSKHASGDNIPLMYLRNDPETFSLDFGRRKKLAVVLTILFFGAIVALCAWLNQEV